MEARDDRVEVRFSISLTRTYDVNEIFEFMKQNTLEADDLETTLRQMIVADAINAIRDGKGSFNVKAV